MLGSGLVTALFLLLVFIGIDWDGLLSKKDLIAWLLVITYLLRLSC